MFESVHFCSTRIKNMETLKATLAELNKKRQRLLDEVLVVDHDISKVIKSIDFLELDAYKKTIVNCVETKEGTVERKKLYITHDNTRNQVIAVYTCTSKSHPYGVYDITNDRKYRYISVASLGLHVFGDKSKFKYKLRYAMRLGSDGNIVTSGKPTHHRFPGPSENQQNGEMLLRYAFKGQESVLVAWKLYVEDKDRSFPVVGL